MIIFGNFNIIQQKSSRGEKKELQRLNFLRQNFPWRSDVEWRIYERKGRIQRYFSFFLIVNSVEHSHLLFILLLFLCIVSMRSSSFALPVSFIWKRMPAGVGVRNLLGGLALLGS
uniref:Uncharacterized protein n=1 Tax=Nelumbo nucifera TaxID=4432 RepID=A0A822ZHK1_NELNU|nr:TPA_asm: hypothetical protein HUJ06_001145 [Nelumbo nucifera]